MRTSLRTRNLKRARAQLAVLQQLVRPHLSRRTAKHRTRQRHLRIDIGLACSRHGLELR